MSFRSWVSSFMCMAFLYSSVKYQGTHGRCNCTFSLQGKTYNITSLQSADDTARFTVEKGEYMFSYNPCRSFHFVPTPPPTGDCQDDLAMCYWFSPSMYHKIASQSTAKCGFSENYNLPMLQYTGDSYIKKTTVLLKCEPSIKKPNFTVVDTREAAEFVFELTHKCACPDACVINPLEHTTKDPTATTVSGFSNDNTVVVTGAVTGGLFVIAIIAIVIKRRDPWRRRRQNEGEEPILGENGGSAVEETRNNFQDSTSGGSGLASGSGSVRRSSSGSSVLKKDDINSKINNTEFLC